MTAKNEHTGDLIRTKYSSAYRDNYDQCFRDENTEKKGKWIKDPSSSARSIYVSDEQFEKMHKERENRKRVYVGGFPALHTFKSYNSPVTGELIEDASQERNHLKQHNCRIYEGFEQEQRVADAHKAEVDSKFESKMLDAMDKTANDLKYNMVERADPTKPLNIFNDD